MKVIHDNDGSSDDIIALLYLLSHPEITIESITLTGTGEVHGPIGAENMALLCQYLNRPNIPIAYGNETPCSPAGKPFPAEFRTEIDNTFATIKLNEIFKNIDISKQPKPLITSSAVELIKTILEKNEKEKVTILATGPLTNIAEFIQQYAHDEKYSHLIQRIEKIVIMGGAVKVDGNIKALDKTSDNTKAEWNIYADPKAAEIVFASGIPVTLVPLDATNHVPMTEAFYDDLKNKLQPELKLIYELFNNIISAVGMDVFLKDFYLWDPLAAMVCADPEHIAIIENIRIEVDQETAQTKPIYDPNSKAPLIQVTCGIQNPTSILEKLITSIKQNFMNMINKTTPTNLYQPAQNTLEHPQTSIQSVARLTG